MHPSSTNHLALQNISVASGLAVVAVALCMIFPRAAPGSVALMLAAAFAGNPHRPDFAAFNTLPPPILAAFALAAWSLVSVAWAVDRVEAIGKALLLGLLSEALWIAFVGISALDRDTLNKVARASAVAFAVCLIYLLVEEITGHFIKRFLFEWAPLIRPVGKQVAGGSNGDPLLVSTYITNRNMAAMSLLLWPCVFIARNVVQPQWKLIAPAVLIASAALTAAMSAHETSMIALVVSAIVLAIGFQFPRLSIGLVAAGWLVACLLVVPIVHTAFRDAKLHTASWIPSSARQRIVLWAYTAEQVTNHPIIGVGTASTKVLDARRGPRVEPVPGTKYEWRSAPHAHNVYLQTWYELGAVGAALLSALGLTILYSIHRMPAAAVPYAVATLAASAVTGAFSWGMWQAWFMALFAFAAVVTVIAGALRKPA